MVFRSLLLSTEKNTPIIYKSGDITIRSENNIFFKSDGSTLGTPRGQLFIRFSGNDVMRKKRHQKQQGLCPNKTFMIHLLSKPISVHDYLGPDELARIHREKPIDMFRFYSNGHERVIICAPHGGYIGKFVIEYVDICWNL